MPGFTYVDVGGPSPPRLYRGRKSALFNAGGARSYSLLRTKVGSQLCSGHAYRHSKSWRLRAAVSVLVLLRIGVVLGLSLAVPAQAHGSTAKQVMEQATR